MHKLKRSHIYVLVILIVGLLLYWVVSWYTPPVTSEREAINAVMNYLKDYPDTKSRLAGEEIRVYDDGMEWFVTIDLPDGTLPAHVIFKVNKITGEVKPMPVR